MTENEKINLQIKAIKDAIKALKININGINLHLSALDRQVRKIAQKK